MRQQRTLWVVPVVTLLLVVVATIRGQAADKPRNVTKTDQEWRKQLTRAQYLVCRMKETEAPFTGKLVHNHAKGTYYCVCCDAELFSSRAKFESGTGWPSFWRPIAADSLDTQADFGMAEERVEVMCNNCGAHLGHVFSDGPPPTGLRYCMNSAALKFVKESMATKSAKPKPAPAKAKPKAKGKAAPEKSKTKVDADAKAGETGDSSPTRPADPENKAPTAEKSVDR